MKTKGVIRGMTIELQTATDLPDGQEVEVEISSLTAPATVAGNLDPSQDDVVMRAADELRQSIAARWGRNLNRSVDYVREDRDR